MGRLHDSGIFDTALPVGHHGPPVLGLGAQLKAGLCLIRDGRALLTAPLGDLDLYKNVRAYDLLLDRVLDLAGPDVTLAHDLHPDFHATRRAASSGLPAMAVQHHHAHIAAVNGENGMPGPAIGLALDGFGLGDDGGAWGGELLRVEGADFRRLGHLAKLPQPGGDLAAQAPWRMGVAALHHLGRAGQVPQVFAAFPQAGAVSEMLARGVNCPPTSSCGRLFDAACGLLDVHAEGGRDGAAPRALQALATAPKVLPHGWRIGERNVLDFAPLLDRLVGMAPVAGANLFHGTLVAGLADWTHRAAKAAGIGRVALGGGCFLNARLTGGLTRALSAAGLQVLTPRRLPPDDAAIGFGQAMIAAAALTAMN